MKASNSWPSSDDVLLAHPELGRCYTCFAIVPNDELHEVPMDEPTSIVWLCDSCWEREQNR
jgi:hypothetical protein